MAVLALSLFLMAGCSSGGGDNDTPPYPQWPEAFLNSDFNPAAGEFRFPIQGGNPAIRFWNPMLDPYSPMNARNTATITTVTIQNVITDTRLLLVSVEGTTLKVEIERGLGGGLTFAEHFTVDDTGPTRVITLYGNNMRTMPKNNEGTVVLTATR